MGMSREAMKLALEALEMYLLETNSQFQRSAVTALREALAEQPAQQEPVAWMYPDDYERMSTSETFCTVYSVEVGSATRGESTVALYTSPPAQRKPLTDEAIATVYWGATGQSLRPQDNVLAHNFARSIEAAHGIKEKNT